MSAADDYVSKSQVFSVSIQTSQICWLLRAKLDKSVAGYTQLVV